MHISGAGFLITQIKHIQGRVFEKLLQASGIDAFNGPQGTILYALWQEDGQSAGALAGKTGLAKTTLTSMLARMEEKGLIRRTPDPADQRRILVNLSDEADALHAEYQRISREMTDIYAKGFTWDEISRLETLLERVLENLQEEEKNLKEASP